MVLFSTATQLFLYWPGDFSSLPVAEGVVSPLCCPLKDPNRLLVTEGEPAIDSSSSEATLLPFGAFRPCGLFVSMQYNCYRRLLDDMFCTDVLAWI